MNRFLSLICIFFSFSSIAQIGVNISLPSRGGTYIDLSKENYRWNNLETSDPVGYDEVDEEGWPTINVNYIVDFRPVAEWVGSIDDPEVYRLDVSGTWSCSFNGLATVTVSVGGSIIDFAYDAGSNTTSFGFVVDAESVGFFILNFDDTKRTAADATNTNFKMLRPGYDNDDALFHTPFLNMFDEIDFTAIRYMDYTHTNGSDPNYPIEQDWEDRKLPTDASQAPIGPIAKHSGGSWEDVIDIANRTQTDAWINVPLSASTDYVTGLANLFKDNLDAGLNLYVESSNEVWNTAPDFSQSIYNENEGIDLGISATENHARRTIEIAEIFETVFGDGSLNNKIRVVLCSHKPMLNWWVVPMLEYVETNFGTPSDYIYAIGCQTYFSGGVEIDETVASILTDCHTSIVNQIDDEGVDLAGRIQWIEAANTWNFEGGFVSYEGGPDHGGGSTVNVANRIMAERSEGMCEEMRYNLEEAFLELGGTLAMHFTLTSAYNRYGSWGITDDVNVPDRNFKFNCMKDLLYTEPVSLPVENKEFLTVYPNPSSSIVNFSFAPNQNESAKLMIYDALGRTVYTADFKTEFDENTTLTWNVENLRTGIYHYSIAIGAKMIHGAVVVGF